ncbi:hypothetical protein JI58_03095, partial [Marinosulfonomonas sp. PRT-SC04]
MPPISPKQIPSQYQKALGLQNAGKLNEALAIYQAIFKVNPRIAEVHFQVARIFTSGGKYTKALPHMKEAVALKPAEAAIWQVWAEVLQSHGDKKQITQFLKDLSGAPLGPQKKTAISAVFSAKKSTSKQGLDGANPQEIATLISYMNAQQFQRAQIGAQTLLKSHPGASTVAHILATAQARQGESEAALASFRHATTLAPNAAIIHNDLGRLLLDVGRPVDAAEALRRALNADPKLAIAISNLARALARMDQDEEAMKLARKACKLAPKLADAQYTLGTLLTKAEQDGDAIEAFQAAIRLGDKSAQVYAMMARAQGVLRHNDAAIKNFSKAIKANPDYAFAYSRRAALLQTQGDFVAASADFHKAIELEPNNGETYRTFSASHKFSADDPLLAQMKDRFADKTLTENDRMNFGFALSKAMDDCKEYKQVFPYLNTANGLMRKAHPYDVNTRAIEIENI